MICILAGNYFEAMRWAEGQLMDRNEWFYPKDISDLYNKENFHVIVVGTAGQNVSSAYFEKVLHTAQTRGRMNRK